MDRVDQRYALHKLTALEADACLNAMQHSPHARLRVSSFGSFLLALVLLVADRLRRRSCPTTT